MDVTKDKFKIRVLNADHMQAVLELLWKLGVVKCDLAHYHKLFQKSDVGIHWFTNNFDSLMQGSAYTKIGKYSDGKSPTYATELTIDDLWKLVVKSEKHVVFTLEDSTEIKVYSDRIEWIVDTPSFGRKNIVIPAANLTKLRKTIRIKDQSGKYVEVHLNEVEMEHTKFQAIELFKINDLIKTLN